MAHLPQPIEDLDEPLPAVDPVVRAPKTLVVMAEPSSFARSTVITIALVGLTIGAALGAVGIGIVYATHARPAFAGTARTTAASMARADGARRAGAVVALALPDRDGAPAAAPGSLAPATSSPEEPIGPGAGLASTHQRLGRGRTLPVVLRAMGLSNDLGARVIRALRPLINMRALQPSDVVVVQRDPSTPERAVRRVEYRRSDTQVWAVTVAPDLACTGERIEVVKTTERLITGFVVTSTLDAALEQARLHADIVPRLQEIFAALDLGRELRTGDSVRLIVNEERLNGVFFRYARVEAIDYRGAMGRRRAFFQRLGANTGDFFTAQGQTQERGPLRAPVVPPRMTSPFNLRRMHPVLHRVMPHLGIDFGAPMGTPVYAAADGVVISVGSGGPTGNLVRIRHPALSNVETGYAHLSRFAPGLREGMPVRARQLIGYVGSTGRSTGPHLHFSLKRNGQFVDPQSMYGGRRTVPAGLRAEFDQNVARWSAELDALRLPGEPANNGGENPSEAAETEGAPQGAASEGATE